MQFVQLKRREFITLLSGAALSAAWPRLAFAQTSNKARRIAFLGGSSPAAGGKLVVALLDGIRAVGYVEGHDFEMEYRWAEGNLERLPALAEELVRTKPDLIVASIVQAAVASSGATKTIPIVCPLLADPVRLGLIKSDARPGGNVTGLLEFLEGLPGKQLELARDLIPGAARIGLLVNPNNVNNLSQRRELETAVATMAVKIVAVEVRTPQDLDSIIPTLSRERVDAVIVLRVSLFFC
jgi:putative tryptophan/tyrosine transport system substrate-binding protein